MSQPEGQRPAQNTSPQESKSSTHWWDWFIDNGANWVIVALTIVLAVVGGLQWWATRTMVKHNAVIERAYVTMSHIPPGIRFFRANCVEPRYDASVSVRVENNGNTPAIITFGILNLSVVKGDLPPSPDYGSAGQQTNLSLVKGGSYTVFQNHSVTLSSDAIQPREAFEQMEKEGIRLCLTGYIDYVDRFEKHHRSGYGRVYAPSRDNPNTTQYWSENGGIDEAKFFSRNNLPFVMKPGYNYDIVLKPPPKWWQVWKRKEGQSREEQNQPNG